MALVKSFVTLHGGTVTAASQGPGHGSEFVVRLPQHVGVAAPADQPARMASVVTPTGKRILVVDDNEDARELLGELLRMLGHEVRVAHDGPSALEQLSDFSADVAILDLGLPVMDGFELARRVVARKGVPRPRLVAVTGYGRDRDIAQSHAVGFDAHLVKPVEISALIAALDPSAKPDT